MDLKISKLLIFFTDLVNVRVVILNKNNSAKIRYINIRYKEVINKVDNGDFGIRHVSTDRIIADRLTKSQDRNKYELFLTLLGLIKTFILKKVKVSKGA